MTHPEFKQARQSLGLTQSQIAAIFGWRQEHVSRVETGREPLTRVAALAMQALLMGYRPGE